MDWVFKYCILKLQAKYQLFIIICGYKSRYLSVKLSVCIWNYPINYLHISFLII